MVELEEASENLSENEVDEKNHNRLLSAVSRIYNKQRVGRPKRSEPYVNVSEYHLSNYGGNESAKEEIQVFDLVKVLDRKTSHLKIKSKFSSIKDRSSKLPKPLEKVYEDKIKRSVGYEHLKQHVSRWNEIVEQNHVAPQLSFPLNQDPDIKVYKPLEFLHTFKEPTELEKNMAEVLQQSSTAQLDSQVEEAIFSLSIPEMIEKRRLMAKLKAKESFKVIKAMKQNKIKSKKYRRILRKERLKQELKDFETLEKTDPEAALEKLNKLEKERAEERASLRHRNTGKWARGQAIRAKYDVEARKQLAEQIAKSRELTRKKKLGAETSSESDEDEEDNAEERPSTGPVEGDDNPWTQEAKKEDQTVEEFIAGYQNYWKNKKAVAKEKPTLNKAALSRLICKDTKNNAMDFCAEMDPVTDSPSIVAKETKKSVKINDSPSDEEIEAFKYSMEKLKSSNTESRKSNKDMLSRTNIGRIEEACDPEKGSDESEDNSDPESLSGSSLSLNNTDMSSGKYEDLKISSTNNNNSVSVKSGEVKVSSLKKGRKRRSVRETANKTCIKNVSGSWEVTPERPVVKSSKSNKRSLDDIFDKMEEDMQFRVKERLRKFECIADEEPPSDSDKKKKSRKEDVRSRIKTSEVSLILESAGNETVSEDKELENLLKVVEVDCPTEQDENKEPAIDPNRFLNVKPRTLRTQIPDVLVEGDDVLDDPEDGRRLEISEAFAEDDVVEEFRKEKEDEVKASGQADVDLFLPGWGSWGGPSIDPLKTARKKKRFFIKAPKLQRKDSGKPNVIINQDISDKYKTHLVSEVPYPFTTVRDYEASIRAPIGSTWVPETSVNKLTRPPVVKRIGKVIEPMTETYLLKNKRKKAPLKVCNADSTDGSDLK